VSETRTVLIFGASARAAAFSALRAGFQPWCADLFADADLRQRVPAMQLPGRYPEGFLDLVDVELPGPWLYTSGLENRPFLVRRMARRRPLWGNEQASLVEARSPFNLGKLLLEAKLPGPGLWAPGDPFRGSAGRRWLVKPLAGSGGAGIRLLDPRNVGESVRPDRCYLQEYLEGEARAAVFLGDGRSARLLGLTQQLVGETWLHAAPYQYCGSIGPIALAAEETARLSRLGDVLASGCGLRGLFGVDGIWRHGALWPVEINPRYTASVEVIEYATGIRALAWHGRVFEKGDLPPESTPAATAVVGKSVLFARGPTTFPASGPWSECMASRVPAEELPTFADIPAAGTPIETGHPVLTVFARASSTNACLAALRDGAAEVDRRLFGR
jgi:predicted ATP-grasp superfamily ATP-dependent carboligase